MKVMLTHRSTVDKVGGVATFIFELADAFIMMGHEVSVLTFSSCIRCKIREKDLLCRECSEDSKLEALRTI
jgi:hypothetical protein